MSNADKNWNVRTKRKFNLFVLNVVKEICLIKSAVTAWLMKMIIDDLRHNSIMWRIFLTIHTISIIFNSMDQYFISVSIRILLKNIINWISFLVMIMSFFLKSFWIWKIMILKSFFFETSTSINVDFIASKWIKKFDLLNLICKYSYNWYFALIDWSINVFWKMFF